MEEHTKTGKMKPKNNSSLYIILFIIKFDKKHKQKYEK